MRATELQKYAGKVVSLDLVNGQVITTRIDSVSPDGFAKCKKPLMFTASINPSKPTEVQVGNIPYGAPLYKAPDYTEISCEHILMIFDVPPQMQEAYTMTTSGVSVAKAGLII